MPIRSLLIVALALVAVAGCGRRGALEDPVAPDAIVTTDEAPPGTVAGETDTIAPGSGSASNTLDATSPGAQEPEIRAGPAPSRPFFLDFLL